MRYIEELVETIDDELEGAKDYAEKYLQLKAEGDSWSTKFKELANTELSHALTIHDYAVQKIDELKRIYTAPVEMQEMWDTSHKKYIEKTAWIKQMLTM